MPPNNQIPGVLNSLAPQWMGMSPQLADVCDVETDIPLSFVIAGGLTLEGANGLQLAIDTDADVLVREILFGLVGDLTSAANRNVVLSNLRVRIHDGDGGLVTSDYVYAVDLIGSVPPALGLRRGSQLFFDLQNVGLDAITAQFLLRAVKRTLCKGTPQSVVPYLPHYKRFSSPPAGFHDEPYAYYFEFALPGTGQPLRQIPLAMDNDAAFIWRAISGAGDRATVSIRIYDANNQPLFNVQSPVENALSTNPGAQAPLGAEVEVARGGVLFLDASNIALAAPVVAPLVTAAPVLIDAATFLTDSVTADGTPASIGLGGSGTSTRYGIQIGTKTYAVFGPALGQASVPNGPGGIFRSLNNGATWARMDAANQPARGIDLVPFYRGTGATIDLAFTDAAKDIFLSTFNTTTDLYGVATAAAGPKFPPAGSGPNAGGFMLTRLSNGDLYVYLNQRDIPNNKLPGSYLKFSGGLWGGLVAVTPSANNFAQPILGAVTDANDRTHVVYEEDDLGGGTGSRLYYVQVDALGNVGARQQIVAGQNQTFAVGAPVIQGGAVRFPFIPGVAGFGTVASMLVGAPLSAPVWTIQTVDPGGSTVPAGSQAVYPHSALDTAGNPVMFWSVNDNVNGLTEQTWMSTYVGGAWTRPILFYDALSNNFPGAPGAGTQYIHGAAAILLPTGAFGFFVTMAATVGNQVAGFFLRSAVLVADQLLKFELRGVKRYQDGC